MPPYKLKQIYSHCYIKHVQYMYGYIIYFSYHIWSTWPRTFAPSPLLDDISIYQPQRCRADTSSFGFFSLPPCSGFLTFASVSHLYLYLWWKWRSSLTHYVYVFYYNFAFCLFVCFPFRSLHCWKASKWNRLKIYVLVIMLPSLIHSFSFQFLKLYELRISHCYMPPRRLDSPRKVEQTENVFPWAFLFE